MTDKPIIFSAPMVRALLDGRKTQTRRLIKPQNTLSRFRGFTESRPMFAHFTDFGSDDRARAKMPIELGDRLWVRENCRAVEHEDGTDSVEYMACGGVMRIENTMLSADRWGKMYHYGGNRPKGLIGQTVPSIHMPRWASRLTLEVTDVRIQRLGDINESDAKAEGAEPIHEPNERKWEHYAPHAIGFVKLWDSINLDRASWGSNPWVVAYTFTVQRGNIDQCPS